MASEDGDYVSDVEYIPGFYPDQAPARLDLVCLLNGFAPPPREDGAATGAFTRAEAGAFTRAATGAFTWCDLGCGCGLTVNLLATAHPAATFHGIDFHPGHIARARADAPANAIFHAASFEDVADDDALPLFDYITLHGVYSWVGPETQRAVVRFLERRLKPGGVALVSYNTVPGWRRIAPLQRLLRAHAEQNDGDAARRVRAALGFARALKDAGASGLADVDLAAVEAPLPGRTSAQHDAYLAHEYLNGAWRPLLHSDVAGDFAAAGLTYAGSARVLRDMKALSLSAAQRAVLDGVADPVLRESLTDYCDGPMLRYDVFTRGARRLSAAEADERLRAVPLGLIRHDIAFPFSVDGPGGAVVLEQPVYGPILAALAGSVRTVGELLDLPELRGRADAPGPRELAAVSVGCDIAWPVSYPAPPAAASDALRRFNLVQAAAAVAGEQPVAALAAGVGAGVALERAGAALYLVMADGEDRPPHEILHLVMDKLGEGRSLHAGSDPAALQAAAVRRMTAAREAEGSLAVLPAMWRRMGCL